MRKLSDEDRRAIDLLLDHGLGRKDRVATLAPAASQQRLFAAEKLLKIIGELPAEEPPVGIVERTMALIDADAGRPVDQAARPATRQPIA
jgi:hypothetical protein